MKLGTEEITLKRLIQELQRLDKKDKWALEAFQIERLAVVDPLKSDMFLITHKPGPIMDIHITLVIL